MIVASAPKSGKAGRAPIVRVFAILGLAICMLAGDLGQNQAFSQGSFLQRLFGGERRSRVVEPQTRRPTVRRQRPAPSTPQEASPSVEKAEDARVVLVVGDFLAGGLAEGLQASFADETNIRIVDSSNGSSGFVRDDYYNWPAQLPEMLEAEKPVVVVLMIGANDGQQMRLPEGRVEPLSEPWNTEYEKRAAAFAEIVRDAGIPMLWVGTPSFRLSRLSSYMVAFNEVYKTVSSPAGAEFVDIWEGFVDEGGAFMATGPDVNGQQVRLRASDGINMTQAGRAKMAFYVERPLRRILGDPTAPAPGNLLDGGVPGAGQSVDPANVERTPPISLNDPDLDGGSELLGAAAIPAPDGARSPRDLLVLEGLAPDPQPGRADAYAAAPPAGDGVTATASPAERTNAIAP